jgi:hypothetical protein
MSRINSLSHLAGKIVSYPLPLRIALLKSVLRRMTWISYAKRLELDALTRPSYGFCIYHAALLAKALGHGAISVLEFGVAGGNGLVNIERHVDEITKELAVDFEVYGFDLETGLPKPLDYRDMPYMWAEGFYKMDKALLQRRLRRAKLVIGDVSETCADFFAKHCPAPIGCVMFDLDYYSSTAAAFKIFDAGHQTYLPRVYCYFDDIASGGLRANSSYVGVLRAIDEFNESNQNRKIARISGLATSRKIPASWNDHIFVMHDFTHPRYSDFIGNAHQSIPLE